MCLGGGRGRNADLCVCVCVWMIDEANCVLFRVKKKAEKYSGYWGRVEEMVCVEW